MECDNSDEFLAYFSRQSRLPNTGAAGPGLDRELAAAAPGSPTPGIPSPASLGRDLTLLLRALYRGVKFLQIPFSVTNAGATLVLEQENRLYLGIQNNSPATMLLGFGFAPTALTGFQLLTTAFYEPWQIPDNELYILGTSGVAQPGVIIYATAPAPEYFGA